VFAKKQRRLVEQFFYLGKIVYLLLTSICSSSISCTSTSQIAGNLSEGATDAGEPKFCSPSRPNLDFPLLFDLVLQIFSAWEKVQAIHVFFSAMKFWALKLFFSLVLFLFVTTGLPCCLPSAYSSVREQAHS